MGKVSELTEKLVTSTEESNQDIKLLLEQRLQDRKEIKQLREQFQQEASVSGCTAARSSGVAPTAVVSESGGAGPDVLLPNLRPTNFGLLQGLSDSKLNGMAGFLGDYVPEKKRWQFRFNCSKRIVLIKGANFQKCKIR